MTPPKQREQTALEAAEAWLESAKGVPELSRRCGYEHEAAIYGWLAGYHAGRAAGLADGAEIAARDCCSPCVAQAIRAAINPVKDGTSVCRHSVPTDRKCDDCRAASTPEKGDTTPERGGR